MMQAKPTDAPEFEEEFEDDLKGEPLDEMEESEDGDPGAPPQPPH